MISAGPFRRFTCVSLCALTTLAATSAAFADVTLVQTVTTQSNPPRPGESNKTFNATIYYKGNKVRNESPEQIVLLDGDTKQSYIINKAQKTYTVVPVSGAVNTPGMDMMRFNTKATVTPTGQTKVIAGKAAKGYKYNVTITMSMNAKGEQMLKAQGRPAAGANMFPTIRIAGETWTSDAFQVPAVAAQAAYGMLNSLPGMGDASKKLTSIKGVPLESSTTMNMKGGMMAAAGAGAQGVFMTNKTVTTKISQNPLSASLFTVPAGYKKVGMMRPAPRPMRQPAP